MRGLFLSYDFQLDCVFDFCSILRLILLRGFVAWFCAFVILYIDKAFGEVTVLSLKPYLTDNLTDK